MSAGPTNARDVFVAAVQLAPEQWDAYLADACGGDEALRARVRNLLAAHREAGSFLEPAVAGLAETTDEPVAERPGTVIGPYKLLEQIGEGGFGAVYLAEQSEPVRRKVALKVLKPGMDTRQVVARFEAERQALAIMDHPNIARVFDGGATPSGRPYFVMELVKGTPITEFCDQNHLAPRERLELFVQVCQAVQHAHQKGVIHRDLKPSNVLVSRHDATPVVKVIDFGVAKALGQSLTDKTLFTGVAQMIGTPLYMSPEQAGMSDLDVDTRSDIYSLGVLLYELLTGSTPFTRERFKQAAYDEIRRIIREEEPPKPSTRLSDATASLPSVAAQRQTEPAKLTKLVRGELDWIVMKALEKDRNRRYESANGFALDVQRYLADEPVLACPPSAGYRLRKFARRNRGGLAAAAGVLVFLVMLGSGVGWALRDRSAREAEAARQRAERQAKAGGQVDSIFAEVDQLETEQKWPEALAAIRRAEAVVNGGEADEATAERVRQRLKDLAFIARLEQIRLLQLASREQSFDYAAGNREYARAFTQYGIDIDELTVEAAIEQLKARPTLAVPLGVALDDWARARSNSPLARDDANRLVAVARGIDPEPLRDRLRANRVRPAPEVEPELCRLAESINIRAEHPATLQFLASELRRVQRLDRGARLLLAAQRAHPGDFWVAFELAYHLQLRGDNEGAARFYTAALAIRPLVPIALSNLGSALAARGKLDEAVAACRRAIEIDSRFSPAHTHLGVALDDQGKLDEAAAAHRRAIEVDSNNSVAHSNLGKVLLAQKKPDEAVAALKRAIELDSNHAIAHNNLGNALYVLGKPDEAAAALKRAIEIDRRFAGAYFNYGILLRDQGKLDEAAVALGKATELDPKNARHHVYLGSVLSRKKDLAGAIKAYREAVWLDPYNSEFHNILGNALRNHNKQDEAVAAYERAIELDPHYADARNNLGAELQMKGRLKEAEEQFHKALAIWEKRVADSPESLSNRVQLGGAYCNFGLVVHDAGQPGESLPWFGKAIDTLRTVLETDPRDAKAQEFLWKSYHGRATAYDRLKKHPEALTDWDKAVELSPSQQRPFVRASRAVSRGYAGQTAEAVAEVSDLLKFPGYPPNIRYDFACVYSLASTRIAEKKTEYADRAMTLLQQAVKDGYQDAAHMRQDRDLDALRDREDFKKLLTELETRKK